MELIILSEMNLQRLGIIDNASSVIWTNKYFSSGEFSFTVRYSSLYYSLLQKNRYVIRNGIDEIGIIETITYTKDENNINKIIVSGRFAQSLLSRRIIWDNTLLQGNLLEQLHALIRVNAIESPENARSLIPLYDERSFIGNYYKREEKTTVKLETLNGNIEITQYASGFSDFVFETPYIAKLGLDVSFYGGMFGVNVGNLLKNPFTNIADSIENKGSILLKTQRNEIILDFKTYIQEKFENVKNATSLSNTNISDSSSGYHIGFKVDLFPKGAIFCDKCNFRENIDGSSDKYMYIEDGFLFFVNVFDNSFMDKEVEVGGLILTYDVQANLQAISEAIEALPSDIYLLYTLEESKTLESTLGQIIGEKETSYYIKDSSGDYSVCVMMLHLATENDKVKYIDSVLSINSNTQIYEVVKGNNLLEYVQNHLQANGIGIKAIFDYENKKLLFSFFNGKNRTRKQTENKQVLFSQELDNLLSYSISESIENKKNVARIVGEISDSEVWGEYGISSGLERFETFEDIGDISDVTEIDYLQSNGGILLQTFSIAIDTEIDPSIYTYRQDYNIGDIVTIHITDMKMQYDVRILEVCETWDISGYKITLILGE